MILNDSKEAEGMRSNHCKYHASGRDIFKIS